MNFNQVRFLLSAHASTQLPAPLHPEIAFAGRSNVGKSSLINRLVNRLNLVKTSAKPGKTQSLNYFVIDEALYFVDLPGYGYAKVSQRQRAWWGSLISRYVESRESLACVVVIVDLRHPLKELDRALVDWLTQQGRDCVLVYTKADKLSRNEQSKNAALLDAGFGIQADDRIIFSAKNGMGCEALRNRLARHALQ